MCWSYHPGGSHYHVYQDGTGEVSILGEDCLTENGHYSFSPVNRDWMLSDTYPNADNIQTLFLFQVSTGVRTDIGEFYHDPEQSGHVRCDLHPRWSRDGRTVCVDSTKTGQRQMYLVDVSPVTET
jgi:Tol biopolymer transport system component